MSSYTLGPSRDLNDARKRKRGLFSCDRCKVKKIACYRPQENDSLHEPCVTCQALKVECKTTIKRKKRSLSVDAAISQANYRYMQRILSSLYPQLDCSDTSQLAELSRQLGGRPGYDLENDIDRNEDNYRIQKEDEDESNFVVYSGKSFNGIVSTASTFGLVLSSYDRVIYDNDGISHYLGSFGFTSVLTILINNLMLHGDQKDPNSIRFVKSMNKRGSIISSFSETIHPDNFNSSESDRFPWICYFTKEESDFYVERFFCYNHRLLNGIDKKDFEILYDTFWKIEADNLPPSTLSYAQYCCIYTVWITGVSMELFPNASMQVTYELMNQYINLIKFLLSDIFLIPSTDGIRCLLLLSNFFERNMQLETAYILCQTAVCHAMSCGYHRESVSNDEKFNLWWALFDREIKLGLYLGRSSTISLKQVNLNYKKRFKSSLDENREFNMLMVEMNRITYHFLCNRTKLPLASKDLTDEHIKSALNIEKSFKSIFTQISVHRVNLIEIAEALLNYYWLSISSNVPFVLYPIEYSSIFQAHLKSIIKLVDSCIKTSMDAVKLILKLDELKFQDPLDLFEASISTYIMAVFLGATLFYQNYSKRISDDKDVQGCLNEINYYSQKLRKYNQLKLSISRGTVRIRRYWVEVLNQDLDSINLNGASPTEENIQQSILVTHPQFPDDVTEFMAGLNTPGFQSYNGSVSSGNFSNMFDIDGIFEYFFNNSAVNTAP